MGALSGTDATLTQAGKAADAKATGDALNQLKTEKVAYADVLTLEEIKASTDLGNKIASAEVTRDLNNRFGYLSSVDSCAIDPGQTSNLVLPVELRIYLLISGHVSWGSNNGVYMFVYNSASSPVRVINLAGTWSATITGGTNGNVTIEADSSAGVRGHVYMVSLTY